MLADTGARSSPTICPSASWGGSSSSWQVMDVDTALNVCSGGAVGAGGEGGSCRTISASSPSAAVSASQERSEFMTGNQSGSGNIGAMSPLVIRFRRTNLEKRPLGIRNRAERRPDCKGSGPEMRDQKISVFADSDVVVPKWRRLLSGTPDDLVAAHSRRRSMVGPATPSPPRASPATNGRGRAHPAR